MAEASLKRRGGVRLERTRHRIKCRDRNVTDVALFLFPSPPLLLLDLRVAVCDASGVAEFVSPIGRLPFDRSS